jgi:hypothetical protein
LNLKQKKDYINLGAIATEVAVLVKKTEARWGEHGDGIVRGEFCLYDWGEKLRIVKTHQVGI